ncbi:MAG: hypothetical protein QOI29_4086 [Mycobacterium sp.]|jgi:hypothetical protein|nr:hypothetical protein [Mycobacterium sp.]
MNAIYHHFRTREQLLAAVIEPTLDELRTVVESAETRRTPHARAEHMLSGYAALAVRNRGLVAVLAADPSVATVLTERPEWGDLITRQLALLADVDPGPAGEVKAAMVFAGMAGAAGPTWGNLDDVSLREHSSMPVVVRWVCAPSTRDVSGQLSTYSTDLGWLCKARKGNCYEDGCRHRRRLGHRSGGCGSAAGGRPSRGHDRPEPIR